LENVLNIARNDPDIKIVIEHMFCPPANSLDKVRAGLKEIQQFSNIYVTLAALPGMSKSENYPYKSPLEYVKAGREIVGAERIMWGSDLPISVTGDTYEHLIEYIPESGILSDDELRLVFYENAKKVYEL
jgi:predicted TIM-barrel fold metal-dependent hydrolase